MEYCKILKHATQKNCSSLYFTFLYFDCLFLLLYFSLVILSGSLQIQERHFTLEENFCNCWNDL
jgi:hypothetical protein